MNKLAMQADGDNVIVVTRRFDASTKAVYRAHTEPALIQRWMLGPDGWTMPVCLCDARPGGKIRYEWTNADGRGFYLTGEFVELVPFKRIVHVERMFLPHQTPDSRVETSFTREGPGTLLTMRIAVPDSHTLAAMLASGMERGMEAGYRRFEGLLDSDWQALRDDWNGE
jgi:uncharacterized protein YndB with AHSA1/START domain